MTITHSLITDHLRHSLATHTNIRTNPAPTVPLPETPSLLSQQKYYHGPLSRVEAEGLLLCDGDFLIRESSKKPGQYVLTGMADGKAQHLLLMDKQGKVMDLCVVI